MTQSAFDGGEPGVRALVNIPNALTLARIILVPLIVWLIITHEMAAAFVLFLLAGLSDAADGYLAKRFGWHTELGAYLDPIADKVLLVSVYLTLGFTNHLPVWLVIAVVSRDILIIGAFILSWILLRPVTVHPLLVSKAIPLPSSCLSVSSWRSLASGSGLSRSWLCAFGSPARSPSCLQPCISGYG
jgi:cardiolipin synthase